MKPLVFSNGKSQEDVVNEVLNSIKEGNKIIFIHGVCGTGKSAIALNIANNLGKSSIVVPGKNLQNQYKKDYENDKYIIKKNGERLKLSVITGRNNHPCQFLKDNEIKIPKFRKEINSKLNDIFSFDKKQKEKEKEEKSADRYDLPCKIEIKERNLWKLKEYLRQNKNVNMKNILSISDIKRTPVASVCPYWSPVLPEKYDLGKVFENVKKREYMGLENTKFIIYKRKPGCKFYEQFDSFIDSDAIVFNSLKYKLESALNRKPLTEVEIIDEGDEFLDSFSNQRHINLDRLQNSLIQLTDNKEDVEKFVKELIGIISNLKKDKKILGSVYSKEIIPLRETGVYDLLRLILDSEEIFLGIDEESYLFDVEETSKMFEDFFEETYLTFDKNDGNLSVNLVTTNLAKKFKEMVDKNKIIVLMSGTLHSKKVLRDIFGLENFKIIDAEITPQGKIEVLKTGNEIDCKYSNFSSGKFSRGDYLNALDKSVEIAKKPTLIHVNSFIDLPTEEEIKEFSLSNLISRGDLKYSQGNDKTGYLIEDFKQGKTNQLFTTRCSRGIDFPGEQCNSIVFTKYPNPNVQDAFWKILMKTNPIQYWDFYKDKARRELWQKIYRGLRFKDDHVFVLSPDTRVLDAFGK